MPADRKKAFRASLTDEQVAMIKSQQDRYEKDEGRIQGNPDPGAEG